MLTTTVQKIRNHHIEYFSFLFFYFFLFIFSHNFQTKAALTFAHGSKNCFSLHMHAKPSFAHRLQAAEIASKSKIWAGMSHIHVYLQNYLGEEREALK